MVVAFKSFRFLLAPQNIVATNLPRATKTPQPTLDALIPAPNGSRCFLGNSLLKKDGCRPHVPPTFRLNFRNFEITRSANPQIATDASPATCLNNPVPKPGDLSIRPRFNPVICQYGPDSISRYKLTQRQRIPASGCKQNGATSTDFT
jgi:hypothetical protein